MRRTSCNIFISVTSTVSYTCSLKLFENYTGKATYATSQYIVVLFTIASKINVTPKGVYLPISKLHSILAVANLLAHNNKSQICYCGQISLQSAGVNCSFSDNLTLLGVVFILVVMVHYYFLYLWFPEVRIIGE